MADRAGRQRTLLPSGASTTTPATSSPRILGNFIGMGAKPWGAGERQGPRLGQTFSSGARLLRGQCADVEAERSGAEMHVQWDHRPACIAQAGSKGKRRSSKRARSPPAWASPSATSCRNEQVVAPRGRAGKG